ARSKPTSISRVRSGPRLGLPNCEGVTAGLPSSAATGSHVLVASNAPGALPDSPIAARSLNVGRNRVGQKLSSDTTYARLSFGYGCSPKLEPNELLPSTRRPPVTNNRSRQPTI